MNVVRGRNCIIEILISGTYYPIFCAKTGEFVQQQELIEVTSINSGISREYEAGMTTGTLNFSGTTIRDNSGGRVAITYLIQESIRRTAQSMRWRMTDDDGGTFQITFSAIIVSNSISRDVATYSQSTTNMVVTGNIAMSAVITPPVTPCVEVQAPLYIDCVAGQSSVNSALLQAAGVVILEVARSGVTFQETVGTPGNMEFFADLVAGDIEFDTTNPFNAGEWIYILYSA